MRGALQAIVEGMLDSFSRRELAALLGAFGDDAQGIDEVSGSWLRGRPAIERYFSRSAESIGEIESSLLDVHESFLGDCALLTATLEQTYVRDGEAVSLSAPTTVVFHREQGRWKIILFHSIPLANDR